MASSFVVLGKVLKAHGIKGELQVLLYGQGPKALMGYGHVYLRGPDGTTLVKVLHARAQKADKCLLALEGIGDRDRAEALAGYEICVPREALPELPEGEFYWHDLIGMQVKTVGGMDVGRVAGLLATGPHDILVIKGDRGEIMIPAVGHMVTHVDLEARVVIVDPVPGLLDIDAL